MLTNSHKIRDNSKTEIFNLILFQSDQKIRQKYCRAFLTSVLEPLACWLPISVLTLGFLGILVTRRFAVHNFRKKEPLRLFFFSKVFKILCRFCKCRKKFRKYFLIFSYLHLNWIRWTFAFTEREYFSSGVNMLRNSLKIPDHTKTEFVDLVLFQSDQKIWQKYWRADLSSVLKPLTCWLPISVLTRGFLAI